MGAHVLASALLIVALGGAQAFASDCHRRTALQLSPLFAADVALTDYGFSRYPGAKDVNPLYATRVGRISTASAQLAGATWAVCHLEATGHPQAARWVKWGNVAARVVGVVVTWRTIQKAGPPTAR